jgi:NAD(P)-dependent dehydrogenase (short-subunit alcohol dehydrogenase family)
VADIDSVAGKKIEAMIGKQGNAAIFVKADVSRASDAEKMVKTAVETYGRLDILCNNAGVFKGHPSPSESLSEEAWDNILDVNLKGAWLAVKYAIPVMKKQGKGVIINTASYSGKFAANQWQAYSASKGGLLALTRSLALELAPQIRVNSIPPCLAATPMALAFLNSLPKEKAKQFVDERIPMGKPAQPEDVAYAALWLASDEASFVTGVDIAVDGSCGRSTTIAGPGRVRP